MNQLEVIIFLFYLVLFSFLITKISFLKNSGIGKTTLISLFVIKICAGIAYAKFYRLPKNYPTSDTWRFYRLSLAEKDWLLAEPVAFIRDLFTFGYSQSGNLFSGKDTFWNDLKSNIPVKLMAVANVFTFNSYYSNIIIFNFLFLFGLIAIFRVFQQLCPNKKWLILAGVFLMPSVLFWCSGIHKDGLILSALGITIYCFSKLIGNKTNAKYFLSIALCGLLVFALRNYVLFAVIPSLLLWILSDKFPQQKTLIVAGLFLTGIILFFTLPLVIPALNFPTYIAIKQQEFLQLEGGSEIITEPLKPTINGFLSYFPKALDMAFLQPSINNIKSASYLPAAIEALFINVLIVVSLLFLKQKQNTSSLILFCFTFSLLILLICGYTIPFTGAIVRYKSIVLPFLVTPLLCSLKIPFHKKKT